MAKVLELKLQHQSFQEYSGLISFKWGGVFTAKLSSLLCFHLMMSFHAHWFKLRCLKGNVRSDLQMRKLRYGEIRGRVGEVWRLAWAGALPLSWCVALAYLCDDWPGLSRMWNEIRELECRANSASPLVPFPFPYYACLTQLNGGEAGARLGSPVATRLSEASWARGPQRPARPTQLQGATSRLRHEWVCRSSVRCGPPASGFMFPKFPAFGTMTVVTWGWVGPAG